MIDTILLSLVVILSVAGLCEFIHSVRLFFIIPKRRYYNFGLIYLKKHKAEKQLKFAIEQRRWLGEAYGEMVIAVYDDLNADELELCKDMSLNEDVIICPLEFTKDVIISMSKDF